MLSYFQLHPKFPRARAKQTRWKFAAFAYYHREKPNLKSLPSIKKPSIQCFEIVVLTMLTFCWHSEEALAAFAFFRFLGSLGHIIY